MDITLTHIPREEVLRYLGCPGTEDPATLALVEGCSARLLAAARPKWTYRVFDLAVQTDGVRLDCGLLLPGRDLAAHLRGCSRAALLAATLSAPVDALLRRAQAEDLAAAVALDCCATAAVEAVCDLAEAEDPGPVSRLLLPLPVQSGLRGSAHRAPGPHSPTAGRPPARGAVRHRPPHPHPP